MIGATFASGTIRFAACSMDGMRLADVSAALTIGIGAVDAVDAVDGRIGGTTLGSKSASTG